MESDRANAKPHQEQRKIDQQPLKGGTGSSGQSAPLIMPLSSIIYRCVTALIGIMLVGISLLPWALVRIRTMIYMQGEEFEVESDTILVTIGNIGDYLEFLGWPPFYHNALMSVIKFPVLGGSLLILTALLPGRLIRNFIRLAVGSVGLTYMAMVAWNFAPWWPVAGAVVLAMAAFMLEAHLLKGIRGADFRWAHVAFGFITAGAVVYGIVELAGLSLEDEYLRRSDFVLAYMTLGFLFLAGAGGLLVKLIRPGVGRLYSLAVGSASIILLLTAGVVSLGRIAEFAEQYPQEVLDPILLAVSVWLVGAKLLLFICAWAWSTGGGAAGLLTPVRRHSIAEKWVE